MIESHIREYINKGKLVDLNQPQGLIPSHFDSIIDWLSARLSEPSSWRGLTAVITALGIQLAPDQQSAIITAGLAVIGLINVLRKEKPTTKGN